MPTTSTTSSPTPSACQVPGQRKPAWLTLFLTFIGGSSLFFLLRNCAIAGGDTFNICNGWPYLWGNHIPYYVREPFGLLFPYFFYRLTHDLTLSFQLVASLSGGLYLAVLLLYSRKPAFLLINLATITVMNFVGHVEFYSTVAVGLTLYFYLLIRALETDSTVRPVHVMAALGFSYLCHKMAMIYAPTLLWLLFQRGPSGWRRRPWPRRDWERAMICLIAVILIDISPTLVNQLGPDLFLIIPRDDKLSELITPFTQATADEVHRKSTTGVFFWYTIGQPLHWKYFLFFWVTSAPLAVPVIAFFRRRLRGDPALALAMASLIGVIWTFFWNPHMQWPDWDLFCLGWLPANLLAGCLAAGVFSVADLAPPWQDRVATQNRV